MQASRVIGTILLACGLWPAILAPVDPARADDVTVNILSPGSGPRVSDVYIRATVISVFAVASVQAEMEGRSVQLVFNSDLSVFAWEGNLSLAGLAYGTKRLTVTAQDIHGTTGSAIRDFPYDPPPTLEILDPIEASVARPTLRLRARGHDNGPTTVSVQPFVTQPITANDSIDIIVDFSGLAGQSIPVTFTVRDSLSQRAEEIRTVYADLRSGLDEVETAPGEILDIDSNRVLYSPDAARRRLGIAARGSGNGVEVPIPLDREVDSKYAFLTPRGAIFVSKLIGGNVLTARVFEWDGTNLVERGTPNSSTSLLAAGNYAIWNEGTTLIRANTASGGQITISTNAINWRNDLTPEGRVAFVELNTGAVKVYEGASVTTRGTGSWPRLSGRTAVYQIRSQAPNGTGYVYGIKVDGLVLSSTGSTQPRGDDHYRVNNNWVVYGQHLQNSIDALFLRSPTGETRQLPTGSNPLFLGLAPTGDVACWSSGHVTFANGMAQTLATINGPDQGRVRWLDGQWRYLIGRSIFAIHDLVTPVTLQDLAAAVLGAGMQLSWRIAVEGATSMTGIVVQRAYRAAGPFESCSPLLALQPEMGFLDEEVEAPTEVWYRLLLRSPGGEQRILGSIHVPFDAGAGRVTHLDVPHVAADRRTISIGYSIASPVSSVALEIFDVRGRRLFGFDPVRRESGANVMVWPRTNAAGHAVASGVYFVRLDADAVVQVRKVVLLAPR